MNSETLKARPVRRAGWAWWGVVVWAWGSAAFAAGEISARVDRAALERFEPLSVEIRAAGTFRNPGDAREVQVDLVWSSPGRGEVSWPCYFEGQERGLTRWRGRWSPRQGGEWTGRARVRTVTGDGFSEPWVVNVGESTRDGFLHVQAGRTDAFVFDSGKEVRGVGLNLCWEPRWEKEREGLSRTYAEMLPKLAGLGGNFIRVWMCPWNLPLEWKTHGLGKYDPVTAGKLDDLLALAERDGIYVMLVLDYHGVLRTKPDHWGGNNEWKNNPYNQANGGPCAVPSDFFTDAEARRQYQNRLRYLVARWGYHPHLAVWEFWNEVDLVKRDEGVSAESIVGWHKEMAAYLKGLDGTERMVTTSVAREPLAGLWEIASFDFTMSHRYAETAGMADDIREATQRWGKPHVVGEFGFSWKAPREVGQFERFDEELHSGLWRGLMASTPVLPLSWWWDHHEPRGEWGHLKGVSRLKSFLALPGLGRWEPFGTERGEGNQSGAELGLRSRLGALVWRQAGPAADGAEVALRIPGLGAGAYTVAAFDTRRAAWEAPVRRRAEAGRVHVPVLEAKQDRVWAIFPAGRDLELWACAQASLLRERILPYWLETTVDQERGGFLMADDLSGRGQAQVKQLVAQSRMIWGFSHAHLQGFGGVGRDYLGAARQGYEFLRDRMRDRQHGGYFWTTDLVGEPRDARKLLYGQAFAMYGLVEYHRASGDVEAKRLALELYRTIQANAHDPEHGGWVEHFQRDWQPILDPKAESIVEVAGLKSANTHLHLMEAFTELYEVTRDADVRASLEESLRLNQTWFYPVDPGQSAFHRHPDGQRATGPRSDGLSYGHNVEFAWLMVRAERVLGRAPSWDHFDVHLRHTLRHGYDGERGGIYNKGFGNEPAADREKVWWAQAEWVAALSDALGHRPDPDYQKALSQTWDFIQSQMVDPRDGIWIASIGPDGRAKWTAKAHDWKANYHDVRAQVKFVRAFAGEGGW